MATIRTTYKFKCDLDKGTLETSLRNSLMQADALADAFAVTVQRNGEDVDISGMTVYGYLYANATKTTVLLKGTISGSTATVILSEDCYAVPGYASLMIQLHDGDVRHTVLKVDFVVTRTGGTLVIDGDNILPTLAELLGQISAMEQATAEARAATAVANQAVDNVEAFKGEIQVDITALSDENTDQSADIRYVEAKTSDKAIDCMPRTRAAWYQGTAGLPNAATRISSHEYIDIAGYDRVYVVFDGDAKCGVYIDAYKGDVGAYERVTGFGYYTANNWFAVESNGYTAMRFTLKQLDNSNILPEEAAALTDNIRVYVWNAGEEALPDIKQLAEENALQNMDIRLVDLKAADKTVDCLPKASVSWYQGTAGVPDAPARISSHDYIPIVGDDRVYIAFDGAAKCEIYIDVYTGNAGAYERVGGFGYYQASTWFSAKSEGYTAMRFTLKKLDNANIVPTEAAALTDNLRVYVGNAGASSDESEATTKMPVKLRLMQYNIGRFNYGVTGGLASNVEEKIANYKRFLGEHQPDIVGMQEYPNTDGYNGVVANIDAEGKYNADDTLFTPLYPFTSLPFFETILKANITPKSWEKYTINYDDTTYRSKGIFAEFEIEGKTVGVLTGYYNVAAPVDSRLGQLRDSIAKLADYDHGFIIVDSNCTSQDEYDTMQQIATEAGYSCANGGYFGQVETYHHDESGTGFYAIDQIWCKGAIIKNVLVPDVYDKLSSDHLPFVVDVMLDGD